MQAEQEESLSGTMTQVKFTIETDIVSAFKRRCADEGVSMASTVRQWMETIHPARTTKKSVLTRPQRRKAVLEIVSLLNGILEAESGYRDAIPEQFTQRQEDAERACEALTEAIALLEEAF